MTPNRPTRGLGSRALRRTAVLVALVALTGVLSGCDPAQAGAAALVGGYKITDQQVQTDATDVLDAIGAAGGVAPSGDALLRATVQRRVTSRLVSVAAEREGVTVTQGEIDQLIEGSGGRETVAQGLAQAEGQWVPPSQVDDAARTYLLMQKLGVELAPNGTEQDQTLALQQYLVALSEELGVDVSPRYGAWDDSSFQVTGPLDDLSTPAPAAGS